MHGRRSALHVDATSPKDQTNGAMHDDAPEPEADLEPSPDPRDAPPPVAVAELAAACVRFVARSTRCRSTSSRRRSRSSISTCAMGAPSSR